MISKQLKILTFILIIIGCFGHVNLAVSETNKNLVNIETSTNFWSFNSSWDTYESNNYSTGNATSESYTDSTIGLIYGQPKTNKTGDGQAKGWMIHTIEWDCPEDNESGVINISYEYYAFACLRVNSSGYAHVKLRLTFFIDDMQHEVILYNNTIDEINETANFSTDSIAKWSKNLTLNNRTYTIGVNASYEIEYTGNDTQSIALLYINEPDTIPEEGDGETDYWAVLIGVDSMWMNSLATHIPFDENAEKMNDMLLVYDHWQDHISILTQEKATLSNIIDKLRWLDEMDDGDDISLVYYTAHGSNFKNYTLFEGTMFEIHMGDWDIPPEDEDDGYDEFLTTFFGLPLWDDLFNFLLDRLDSESIAVIIDACYSGGMIDENASTWITDFSGEINNTDKVIVTCCGEEEEGIIYKGNSFSQYIFIGLQGYADDLNASGNGDGVVSIEEVFEYAEPRYWAATFPYKCDPQIYDSDNTSEIVLTDVEKPPSIPIFYCDDVTIGQPNISYVFTANSSDYENDNITYGWDWSLDRYFKAKSFTQFFWGWGGYDVENWSDYHNSGDNCTMSHSWNESGIYSVRVKTQDEQGAERIENFGYLGLWSKPKYFLINAEDEIVDQNYLTSNYFKRLHIGLAQSFKPNSSSLSKIKLKLGLLPDYDYYAKRDTEYTEYPLNVSIRENLSGENLAFTSRKVSTELKEIKSKIDWVEFDFTNINVTPNQTYFIVIEDKPYPPVENENTFLIYSWIGNFEENPQYPQGETFGRSLATNGEWVTSSWLDDFCFITYEAIPVIADAGGPYYGLINETIWFNGSASEGVKPYIYEWKFHDLYLDPGIQNWSRTYGSVGNYTVNLTVTDKINNKDIDETWINIRDYNNQPYTPNKPSGPTICKKGKKYEFSTNTTDPDGDPMYYMWDWGDNTTSEWLGPFNSGQTHVASHKWSQWNLYKIKVKAKDVYGNESDWSEEKYVYVRLFPFYSVSPSVYLKSSQTVYFNDFSQSYYDIVNWTWDFGDGNFSYTQNTSHTYAVDGFYNVTLTITDNMSASNVSTQQICIDSVNPEITSCSGTPGTAGFYSDIDIDVNANDDLSGIDIVKINVIYPNNSNHNFTLNNTNDSLYELVFNDSWFVGQYNYTIYVFDKSNNSINSTGHNFNISMQGIMSVCTIKDSYGNNEMVNLTDPPGGSAKIGYELLDDDKVLHIWNRFDSYYFDTSSGIQLTNHYDDYWTHNVLMLGYYNNNQWNLIYRTDELSGFNKEIDCDNETFVNATLWKDLSYGGYDFRLAIRYNLGVNDNELTVIPYIKNLDQDDIPYVLGFGWEMKDIRIDMTTSGDYINVNNTMYYLNQTLDNIYTDLPRSEFYLMENITDTETKSLYLKWDNSLNYKVQVKSRTRQYNAPVTLFIRIGTLNSGQEKYTKLFWYDAEQITYYFNSYDNAPFGEAWSTNPGYMVDGSTSNYASTTSDGDVELCDSNNCSDTDIGTISKVELRVCSYCPSGQRDTILRPVFGGTVDGMECRYDTISSAMWSQWFDITYDPFAPQSWSWTDVVNLDCDVVVENDPIGPPFTLKCSKVEIRVTYTPYSPPEISNPYPSNGSNGISVSLTLNISVSDVGGDNMNITWLSNSSGSWQIFGTNNSVGNGTYHQIFSNATENGKWWYWKVNVTDGENYTESGVYKFYTGYQSKIKNTGSTNIKGYLLIQVHYYNDTLEQWIVADDTINETTPRTINSSEQLGLDTVFNGLVNTQNLSSFGNGIYRIYAAFRDPNGNILINDDDIELVATYEFTITFD